MATRVNVIIAATDNISDVLKGINESTNKLDNGLGRASKSGGMLNTTFGRMKTAVRELTPLLGSIGGAFVLKKAYDQSKDFETALADMGNVTKQSVGDIKTAIMELPPELGAATDLVQGYYQTISSGVEDPTEALDTLTQAAKAAKSAHSEQSDIVKVGTGIMTGFAGQVRDAADAYDLLFAIEKAGKTTFAELVPVMGDLATGASATGVSVNELGASLAVVTQTAGSTSQAATQVEAVMMGLYKPTEEMAKAIKALGYSSGTAMVQELGLAGTLQKVQQQADRSGVSIGKLFESKEALLAVTALARNDFEKFNALVKQMADRTGLADSAWQRYLKTAAAAGDAFKNTIGKELIRFGDEIAPTVIDGLKDIGEWLTENQDRMDKFYKNTGALIDDVVDVAGHVGTFLDATLEGWNALPDVVKYLGIVGAVVGGAQARAALLLITAAIGGISKLVNYVQGLQDMDVLERTLKEIEDLEKKKKKLKEAEPYETFNKKYYTDQIALIDQQIAAKRKSIESLQQERQAQDELKQSLNDTIATMEAGWKATDKLIEAKKKDKATSDAAAAALDTFQAKYKAWKTEMQNKIELTGLSDYETTIVKARQETEKWIAAFKAEGIEAPREEIEKYVQSLLNAQLAHQDYLKLVDKNKEIAQAWEVDAQAMSKLDDETKRAGVTYEKFKKNLEERIKLASLEGAARAQEEHRIEIERTIEEMGLWGEKADWVRERLTELYQLQDLARENEQQTERMQRAWENLGQSIYENTVDKFEQILDGEMDFADSFLSMWKTLAAQIAAVPFTTNVTMPLLEKLGLAAPGSSGSGGSGSGSSISMGGVNLGDVTTWWNTMWQQAPDAWQAENFNAFNIDSTAIGNFINSMFGLSLDDIQAGHTDISTAVTDSVGKFEDLNLELPKLNQALRDGTSAINALTTAANSATTALNNLARDAQALNSEVWMPT